MYLLIWLPSMKVLHLTMSFVIIIFPMFYFIIIIIFNQFTSVPLSESCHRSSEVFQKRSSNICNVVWSSQCLHSDTAKPYLTQSPGVVAQCGNSYGFYISI